MKFYTSCILELIKGSFDRFRTREVAKGPVDTRTLVLRGPRPFGHTTVSIEAAKNFSETNRVIFITHRSSLKALKSDEPALFSSIKSFSFEDLYTANFSGKLTPGLEYVVIVDAASVGEDVITPLEKTGIHAFYILLG